jgi:hypothetical protein
LKLAEMLFDGAPDCGFAAFRIRSSDAADLDTDLVRRGDLAGFLSTR